MRRRVAASLLAFLLSACTSTPGGSPSPTPPGSAEPTPGERVLMEITEECTGLASINDCKNAKVACAKAVELLDKAKAPADDKHRDAVRGALMRCDPMRKTGDFPDESPW